MGTEGNTVWRTILRRSLKAIGALGILLLLLTLIFVGINLFDEKLSPTAVKLLERPPNSVPDQTNLYLALLGFHAPSGEDPVASGKAQVKEDDQSAEARLRDPTRELGASARGSSDSLQFKGELKEALPLTSSIWSFAKTHHVEITDSLKNNAELHARYTQWWQMTGYYETAHPGMFAPFAPVDTKIRSLFLTDLANRLQAASTTERQGALRDLEEDLGLWRIMLRGEGSFISKMLASIEIQGDLLVLGDMVSDPATNLRDFEKSTVLDQFDLKDWRIGDAYVTELRATRPLWQSLATAPDFYSKEVPNGIRNRGAQWMFKANATTNRQAELNRRQRDLADADPAQFLDLERSYREWADDYLQWARAQSIYNPIGRVLLSIGLPDLVGYIPRIYDVAALQRLVTLAYQLRKDDVAPERVPDYMKAHPEWSTHPISGKVFNWNATTQLLKVPTVGKQKADRRFGLTLALKSHH